MQSHGRAEPLIFDTSDETVEQGEDVLELGIEINPRLTISTEGGNEQLENEDKRLESTDRLDYQDQIENSPQQNISMASEIQHQQTKSANPNLEVIPTEETPGTPKDKFEPGTIRRHQFARLDEIKDVPLTPKADNHTLAKDKEEKDKTCWETFTSCFDSCSTKLHNRFFKTKTEKTNTLSVEKSINPSLTI